MTNSFSSDIRTYALAGAQGRLDQLNEEQVQIHRLFPELRKRTTSRRPGRSVRSAVVAAPATSTRRGRRRTMSAAERNAVSERMKKYWAARRGGSADGIASSDSPAKAAKPARGAAKRGPRTMSREARKRVSDAQKARWAKQRGDARVAEASSASESSPGAKSRRTTKRRAEGAGKGGPRRVSAAARKRMSQVQKKRWAAKRKAA